MPYKYITVYATPNITNMAEFEIDEVQSHILGVAAGLMVSYGLTPAQLEERYNYIISLSQEQITNVYEQPNQESEDNQIVPEEEQEVKTPCKPIPPISTTTRWADYESEDECIFHLDMSDKPKEENDTDEEKQGKTIPSIYVTTRREFCGMMQKGIKICPRYSTCDNEQCKNFHIQPEYICSHVNKGSYCDAEGCDLIVIRPCRKGKKCNDPDCSFRHP